MALLESSEKITKLLDKWREQKNRGLTPINTLKEIAELLEAEATSYLLLDPDPFDDRHPARSEPECVVGHLLKVLYEDDEFLSKLLTSYMFNTDNDFELNCCASRLLLDLIPALNSSDIFQDVEIQVGKLLTWAKNEKEPLRSYTCGLLSTAMQMPECPGLFKERNAVLVPLVIKRLKALADIQDLSLPCIDDVDNIDKANFKYSTNKFAKKKKDNGKNDENAVVPKTPGSASRKRRHTQSKIKVFEYNKAVVSLSPLTVGMQQKLMLKYLHPMGEYQELLPVAFELNVMDLVFHYINFKVQPDANLACSALLYLSSLLCHKKFIIEFVFRGGIQKILEIPQPSVVATMSSLCLYYMAYNEDAVERVCLLPQAALHRLIEYLLWLLECSHISGRCHSSLFFSLTFSFRSILNLFDSMDGLRKVVNMISTLKILRLEESNLATDDDVFLDRETAKNACLTLKRYFDAHVAIIADEYRRNAARDSGNIVPIPIPAYRSMLTASEGLQDNVQYIQCYESRGVGHSEKHFCKQILNKDVTALLLQLLAVTSGWKNYNNRSDVMVTILDGLSALSASRKISLTFCQQIQVSTSETQSGIKVLLRAVEGDLIQDIQVQKSALNVICNCVTVCKKAENGNSTQDSLSTKLFTKERSQELHVMQKIWSAVRLNNGIKILLSLINIKTPITAADAVRALACKALCGLSDNELICQVLGKLPIFYNEQLQLLMREPILSDRINEHIEFCKYACALIARVTGKSLHYETGASLPIFSRITKADIVAQTRIKYPQKELLTIIHHHLLSQGLDKTAESLKIEAKLPVEDKATKDVPVFVSRTKDVMMLNGDEQVKFANGNLCGVKEPLTPFQSRKSSIPLTPKPKTSLSSAFNVAASCTPKERLKFDDKQGKFRSFMRNNLETEAAPSLDSIVTGYLREQHAHCTNPVATCPPFSLVRPHQCPEPLYRSYAPSNITKRMISRQSYPRYGGIQGCKHNRRYIYSKFRPSGCIKESEDECIFTSCTWSPDGEKIFIGTQTGDVKMLNCNKQEEVLHSCHGAPISMLNITRNGNLLSTTAPFGTPLGAIWSLKQNEEQPLFFELKFELPEDTFVQFSNSEERVVGTDDMTANVYDLTSGQLVRTFYDQRNASHYLKNFACFGPTDDILLNDGCLWDVRAKNMIHKFDKFNDYVSGIFHPSGLEIIINSEVWDVRTFHLMDTCPALDQCRIVFSGLGDVIYGVKHISNNKDIAIEHNGMFGPYDSSFRTFDALDYSAIGTVDVKKTIFDISPNPQDQMLAVIENGGNISTMDFDTTCRFYNIGRTKKIGEDDSEEELDEESEEQSSSNRGLEDDVMTLFNNIFDDNYDEDDEDFDTIDAGESSNNDDDNDDDDEEESENDDDDDGSDMEHFFDDFSY